MEDVPKVCKGCVHCAQVKPRFLKTENWFRWPETHNKKEQQILSMVDEYFLYHGNCHRLTQGMPLSVFIVKEKTLWSLRDLSPNSEGKRKASFSPVGLKSTSDEHQDESNLSIEWSARSGGGNVECCSSKQIVVTPLRAVVFIYAWPNFSDTVIYLYIVRIIDCFKNLFTAQINVPKAIPNPLYGQTTAANMWHAPALVT